MHLWVDSTDCHRNETVGPDGAWSIDVSVPGDEEWEQMTLTLERGSSGGAEELDQDGDATQAQWHVPNPTFEADIVEDSIHGDQFGDGVVVTISDPTTGQQRSWSGAAINYDEDWFDLYLSDTDDPWDLAAGQTVTITGSNGTRTSVLADLRFTGYDLDANTVSGTTDRAGTIAVELESDQDDAPRVEVRLEAAGAWAVDFDDAGYDLRLLDAVRITQWDDVGAATSIGRTTMAPAHFLFSPVIQDVIGSDWPKGARRHLDDRTTVDHEVARLRGDDDLSASTAAIGTPVPSGSCPSRARAVSSST